MRLVFTCPTCKSTKSEILSEKSLGSTVFKTLSCNHVISEKRLTAREILLKLKDGRELYPFQKIGVEFARDNNFRVLIADEMGLGKTIQAVSILQNFPELRPALIVVKASLTVNWLRELLRGAGILSQILDSDSEVITGNNEYKIEAYITYYDSLVRRKRNGSREQSPATWRIGDNKLDFKILILDEVQMIKNHDSKRTQQVRDLARDCKHIIELSGTPILNNGGEYFPALNLIDPVKFRSRPDFIRFETHSFWDGYRYKVGGLRDPEGFAKKTKNLIIRRTRKEVLPDLPQTRISLRYMKMLDESQKEYDKEVDNFNDFMDEGEKESSGSEEIFVENILAYLNKMRHITGRAKVLDVVEYVLEFLEDRENSEKLTVFHHHHDVGDMIQEQIGSILHERGNQEITLRLKSEQDSQARQEIIDKFKDNPKARILIAPTLACGEGINLQFCSTGLLAEREWNPGKEEQAAPGRFSRIGSIAQFVDVVISVAINSIDEMFAEYIERKRQYVTEAMSGKTLDLGGQWNQSTIIKDIANKLRESGLKAWRKKIGF